MSLLEHISLLPAISPFLCTDSSKALDSSYGPPLQDPYVATVARWRSRVIACPSSSSEFHIAPVTALLGIHRRSAILIRPGEAIPFGRPYRTHFNGPLYQEIHQRDLAFQSSHAAWTHLAEMFRDSYSSEASIEEDAEVGPIETGVDMELGVGDGDDVRYHDEIDPRDLRDDTEEYEANASAGDTVEVGIDPMSTPIVEEEIVEPAEEDSSDSSGTRDGIVRSFEDMTIDLDNAVHDFYHHMFEVRIDRIVGIETAQRRLEADQLIDRGQRVSMIERIDSLRLENLKVRVMLDIERDRVSSLLLHMSLSQEEFR
ncbi:hypothetical protein Tco_0300653 [Tanacetum coccineum]